MTYQLASAAEKARHQREARQLDAVRITFPGWEIDRFVSDDGVTWTARLRRDISPQMREAGVLPVVERPDAPSLVSALSAQVELIHRTRAYTWPT
ncbi:hypothetical protein AB0L05_16115 [Nonomuraea pusilla]|uniref:hypothetical protein n=1 Tax=Nonomuraea pusilla TaxID=46177 RepID=UPI00332DB7CE